MAETRNAFVTVCFPPEEVPVLEFAAKECGQTKSSFIYVLVRNQLRAMGLLSRPAIPNKPPNGKDVHATQSQPQPQPRGYPAGSR
jgi:hypothetical protein